MIKYNLILIGGYVLSQNDKVKLTLNKVGATEEWKVRWYDLGDNHEWRLNEPKCYYSDDKEDAFNTMRTILEHYNRHGN